MNFKVAKNRVMVIAESTVLRSTISSTLGRGGYKVMQAVNVKEALNKLTRDPVDMVITSLEIVNEERADLIRNSGQNESYHYIPVLMLPIKRSEKSDFCTLKQFPPSQILSLTTKVLGQ